MRTALILGVAILIGYFALIGASTFYIVRNYIPSATSVENIDVVLQIANDCVQCLVLILLLVAIYFKSRFVDWMMSGYHRLLWIFVLAITILLTARIVLFLVNCYCVMNDVGQANTCEFINPSNGSNTLTSSYVDDVLMWKELPSVSGLPVLHTLEPIKEESCASVSDGDVETEAAETVEAAEAEVSDASSASVDAVAISLSSDTDTATSDEATKMKVVEVEA